MSKRVVFFAMAVAHGLRWRLLPIYPSVTSPASLWLRPFLPGRVFASAHRRQR